jgi:hypothetical protein
MWLVRVFPFALVACGGAPFTEVVLGPGSDAGPADHADRTELDSGHDSDHPDHDLVDASPQDVHSGPESSTPDVVTLDSTPRETSCVPFGTATVLCPADNASSVTPGTYCVYDSTHGGSSTATTPEACQCATTYTCACLEASVTVPSELCSPTQIYVGCFMNDDAPYVQCEDP